MKKLSLVFSILLMTFMFSGCGKQSLTSSNNTASKPKTSSVSVPASSAKETTTTSESNSQQTATSQIQSINTSMDKLNEALSNSDDSKDINDTDTLINNLK